MAEDLKKIRFNNRRAVESWIAGYERAKEHLKELTAEVAEWGMVSAPNGMPKAKQVQDRTATRAVYLGAVPEIAMTRRMIRAVETVHDRAPLTKKQVMELYFWRGKHYLEVCDRLTIEKSSVYRYTKEITDDVAAELGLLV